MPFKRTPLRYAHTDGHTSCTYTENGDKIITCGSDGDMRIWQGIDDDDPSSKCLGEFVLAVAQYDKRLLVSTDLNVVQAYTFPDGDRDGTEMRFTASVTCIRVNEKFIAAGSEDTEIKVMPRDKSENEFVLAGHGGPILSIDLGPNDRLASSSGDGTIKIWDLKEKQELKTILGFPKVNSFDMVKCFVSACFEPTTGKTLAYVKDKEVIILNASTWEVRTTLTDDNVTSHYACCAFSRCGEYLAAGTEVGELSVWNVPKSKSVRGETVSADSNSKVTAIVWNPKNNGEYAYCDSTGQLGTVVGCNSKGKDNSEDFLASEAIEEQTDEDFDELPFQDNDEDLDNENCVSLERLKNETLKVNGLGDDEDSKDSLIKSVRSSPERVVMKTYQQQGPFQPGSTPSNLEHRYLVWNNVGIVRAHCNDADGTIDVEFHDASIHHALHMNNHLNHTMASLSSSVLALSGESSSKLVCIALGVGVGSREWSVEFPDCESSVAIAATNTLVAVATDCRYLRVFSVMGTQRQIISIPGPIVSVCGHGDKLFIAYHTAPASEDQHIMAIFIQFFGLQVRSKEARIPLSQGKKLTWVGYSDRGSPVICDTMGVVQLFNLKTNCWQPICDTMKHTQSVSNNFFIVDVRESTQIIEAVLCRGTTYPMTNPRPMMTELPMQIPLCELDTEKSQFEETLIRHASFNVDNSELVVKETATKLFALACRTEMEARAKELVEMIASPQLLALAVKYASKLGRIHLVDKLRELLPYIEEKEKDREKEMHESEVELISVIQNSPLNAGLLLMQKNKTARPTIEISPKPMVISNQRRNPFKRSSSNSSTPSTKTANPLSHLTEKAIGFELRKSQTDSNSISDDDCAPGTSSNNNDNETMDLLVSQESEVIPCSINDENKSRNNQTHENTPIKGTFMSWFTTNKSSLQAKHPEFSATELTKWAMKEYKAITNSAATSGNSNNNSSSSSNSNVIEAIVKDAQVNGKRKLDDTSSEKQSGVAKLAKFGFRK